MDSELQTNTTCTTASSSSSCTTDETAAKTIGDSCAITSSIHFPMEIPPTMHPSSLQSSSSFLLDSPLNNNTDKQCNGDTSCNNTQYEVNKSTTRMKKKNKKKKKKGNSAKAVNEEQCSEMSGEERTIASFRDWLQRLSYKELISAMEFDIENVCYGKTTNNTVPYSIGVGGIRSRNIPCHLSASNDGVVLDCNNDSSSSADSIVMSKHEYDLLREMIRLLPCPPIPIHPKVIKGFIYNLHTTIDDGRDPEFMKRKYQFEKPRLFRWIEQQEESIRTNADIFLNHIHSRFSQNKSSNDSNPRKLNRRPRNGMMDGVGLRTSSSDNYGSNGSNKSSLEERNATTKNFDVIARKFVMDDGERLPLCCTKEQQEADEAIVLGTVFLYQQCIAKRMTASTSRGTQLPSRIGFRIIDEKQAPEAGSIQRTVIQMLTLATRGNFGKVQPPMFLSSEQQRKQQHHNQSLKQKYGCFQNNPFTCSNMVLISPWFNPEERWFSLSMYLANCFEVSLWNAYFAYTTRLDRQLSQRPIIDATTAFDRGDHHLRIDGTTREMILNKAICQTTFQILEEEKKALSDDPNKLKIRESISWNLLMNEGIHVTMDHRIECKDQGTYASNHTIDATEERLMMCPAIEIDSKFERWKCLVRQRYCELKLEVVQESIVNELLRQLEHDETHNHNDDSDETHRVVNRKIENDMKLLDSNGYIYPMKKSSKKRKQPRVSGQILQRQNQKQTEQRDHVSTSITNQLECGLSATNAPEENDTHRLAVIRKNRDSCSSDSSSDDNAFDFRTDYSSEVDTNCHYSFPTQNLVHRDRNRNIVIALAILDDIVNDVCKQVGVIDKQDSRSNDEGEGRHEASLETESAFQLVGKDGSAKSASIAKRENRDAIPTAKRANRLHVHASQTLSHVKNFSSQLHENCDRKKAAIEPENHASTSASTVNLKRSTQKCVKETSFETESGGKNYGADHEDQRRTCDTYSVTSYPTTSNNAYDETHAEQCPPSNPYAAYSSSVVEQQQDHIPRFLLPEYVKRDWQDHQLQPYHLQAQPSHGHKPFLMEDSCSTIKRSNLDPSSLRYEPFDCFMRGSWDGGSMRPGDCYSNADGWGQPQQSDYPYRAESILSDFFETQQQTEFYGGAIMVSSTVASIASSAKLDGQCELGEDVTLDFVEETEKIQSSQEDHISGVGCSQDTSAPENFGYVPDTAVKQIDKESEIQIKDISVPVVDQISPKIDSPPSSTTENGVGAQSTPLSLSPHSESLSPPNTPPPTLSPILVSLSDLSDERKDHVEKASSYDQMTLTAIRSFGSEPPSSVANSPACVVPGKSTLIATLSRENLRTALLDEKPRSHARELAKKKMIASPRPGRVADSGTSRTTSVVKPHTARSRDDYDIKCKGTTAIRRSVDALSSYRLPAVRAVVSRDDQDLKPVIARDAPTRFPSYKSMVTKGSGQMNNSWSSIKTTHSEYARRTSRTVNIESSATNPSAKNFSTQSETACEERHDYQNWHESYRSPMNDDFDNNNSTKDASTTITSLISPREPDEIYLLREERNAYRDMCLTLGAEVAKLKNMLAAQANTTRHHSVVYPPACFNYPTPTPTQSAMYLDPESISHHAFQIAPRARTLAAMSDAGYGDHESLASEDADGAAKILAGEGLRQSSSLTIAGSDTSMEHTSAHNAFHMHFIGIKPTRDGPDPVSLNGMQSRLTIDILQFLESINDQLRKQDSRRRLAVERMTRLVNTLWPRAQVKLYGSHVTGLCLPSSDMDFVVCLPAVHKNTIAIAAGELEVRTAINESSQKLLARRLKGESWIDPRSMKLIERTVVPVIKVTTKDTRARTLQLDITFDAPGHHGAEAVIMVNKIMEELPMIRPIIIVLKQFLLDRGLLTAYTGGLSSYCLFLMVARYLQEQPSSWGDCGALLMGFLDFYGNYFDPRTTGISVRHRLYFERPNYAALRNQAGGQQMWHQMPHPRAPVLGLDSISFRRNSFSDRGSIDGTRGATSRLPRHDVFPSPNASHVFAHQPTNFVAPDQNAYDHGMPYTFDPLFVEDPLSETNNVGRNAFRIFQVQRAFSDAHRALVAALEWDMQSDGELQESTEYPLLKCLLQSEDTVFEL